MRVAIAASDGRITPVLDVARRLLLLDFEGRREAGRREVALAEESLARRIQRMVELRIDVLICGALSQSLHAGLLAAGIEILAHRCGCLEQVIAAYTAGGLNGVAFRMPGCHPPHCACRRGRRGGGRVHGERGVS
ncbi:MAG: hypothetical protein H6816_04395 [Phycisphaerales bacterium]|nr:hypothetical protein [Phycisphaerales bacterium]